MPIIQVKNIVSISGPSTIGKDAIWIKAFEQLGYKRHMMYTSRKKREGEINGFDYNFISRENFQDWIKQGDFIAWTYYFNEYYGIHRNIMEVNNNSVFHAIVRLGYRAKLVLPNLCLLGLRPSSEEVLIQRLKLKRNCKGEELVLRKYHIRDELDNDFLCDYVVSNCEEYNIQRATDWIKANIS